MPGEASGCRRTDGQRRAGGGETHILARWGEGAAGSFGAGAPYGLTKAGRLPQFQVVTGVSAGALLAPFACLGPRWDPGLKQAFDGPHADHLLRRRPWLTIVFRPDLYRGGPRDSLVSRFVAPRMIQAADLAAEKGRLLVRGTTDLDNQKPVIWNMGMIVEHGGRTARKLFIQVLVASASIAGIIPLVLKHVKGDGKPYDETQVDGGTTMPSLTSPRRLLR